MIKNILDIIVMLNIFWCFTGLWFFPGSIKLAMGFSILCFILRIVTDRSLLLKNLKSNKFILGSLLVTIIFGHYQDVFFSSFIRSSFTILFLILSLNINKISRNKINYGLMIISIVHLFFLIYTIAYIGKTRPDEILNPNIYSPIFGVILCLVSYKAIVNKSIAYSLLSATLIFCIFSMQSRGVILGSALILTIYILMNINKLNFNKNVLLLISSIFIIFCLIIKINLPKIKYIYKKSEIEVSKLENGNLNSSLGLRVQMTLVASDLISSSPILGHRDNYKKMKQTSIRQRGLSEKIMEFNTLHNVYLDSWARMGIFGFIIFIFFTLYPYIFLRKTDNKVLGIALSLFTFIISMVDTALLGGPYLLVLLLSCHLIKGNEEAKEVPVA